MTRGKKITHTQETKDKISKSMIGNNNAVDDNIDFNFIKTQLKTAILLSEETFINEETKEEKYKYDFIGEIFTKLNTYIDQVHKRIKSKDINGELEGLYQELKRRMENNCYYNTKNNFINTATGIVNLKANHKWSDRVDMTSGDEKINNNLNMEIALSTILKDLKK